MIARNNELITKSIELRILSEELIARSYKLFKKPTENK
jgi:hypothetical protein